jgi:ubiquinone/menaquinone biosynthesis C-methylase UbiE
MTTYQVQIDPDNARVAFEGTLRPLTGRDVDPIRQKLEIATRGAGAELLLDFKRLRHMNQVATLELARFAQWAAVRRPELKIKLVTSSVIPWAATRFGALAASLPNVSIHVYDKAMYPSQRILEDTTFSALLRSQEDVIWAQERKHLPTHGLGSGMKVADIACGIGTFGVAVSREFAPKHVICVDHSASSLQQARDWARQHHVVDVEYRYGDAYALFLPDEAFDFVACRLSMQIVARPDLLMAELKRICKPGGRIYLTNEILSGVVGYPNAEAIRSGYAAYLALARQANLDIDYGMKTMALLRDFGLEDTRGDLMVIDNLNTDPDDFERVIKSWLNFSDDLAELVDDDENRRAATAGLRAQISTIHHPAGYSMWPIFIGSGRKP